MPKRLRQSRNSTACDPIIEARPRKTVQNLRKHCEGGAKANSQAARSTPRELAERFGTNPPTLPKDRRFARRCTEQAKLRLQESDRWLRRCEVILEGSGEDLLEELDGGADGAVRELEVSLVGVAEHDGQGQEEDGRPSAAGVWSKGRILSD